MKVNIKRFCLLAAFCGLCAVSFGGQLFQERFWNTSQVDTKLGVKNYRGQGADNWPYLNIEPKTGKSGFLLLANAPKSPLPPENVNNFDLWFKFRHLNVPSNAPSYFGLALLSADKTKTQMVCIATDSIAGKRIRRNQTDEWSRFVLKAHGDKASIYYAPYGPVFHLCDIPLKGRFAWANIYVQKGKCFEIADFTITTPAVVPPDQSERQFADFRSLSQPIEGGHLVGKDGATVNLTPAPRGGVRFAVGKNPFQFFIYRSAPAGSKEPGRVSKHDVFVMPQEQPVQGNVIGLKKGEKAKLPNACIQLSGIDCQFVRPSLDMYQSYWSMVNKGYYMLRAWNSLPPASKHPLDIDFVQRSDGSGLDIYLDGSLSKTLWARNGEQVTNIVFRFSEGVSYAVKKDVLAKVDTERYTVLDLSANPRAKALVGAKSTLRPGLHDFSGVPIIAVRPIDSSDVSICKQALGSWALEVESYHGRAPRDGFPSAIHYRLPAAPYVRAHILFTLDPNSWKTRFLTVRMAHYVKYGSGANMIADSVIDLTDGKEPAGYEKVGKIRMKEGDVPIYRAEVPLDLGKILDVVTGAHYDNISSGGYIDFELLGKCGEGSVKPDENSDSAFNILGITLEKLPVNIGVVQESVANVFTVDDGKERKMSFIVTATEPNARGSVSWTIRDSQGKELVDERREYNLAEVGSSNVFEVALWDKMTPGHYPFEVVFTDENGKNHLTHKGAFAVLPSEARMVDKLDSPYGVWWFAAHGSPWQAYIGGPLMRAAGIVRNGVNSTLKPEDNEKYRLTGKRAHYMKLTVDKEKGTLGVENVDGVNKPTEECAEYLLREALKKDPTIDTVMLWHESAPGYGIPEELLGLPVPTNSIAKDKVFALQVNAAGQIVRKVSKELNHDLRLQIGNSSASIGAAVRPLRAGANPDYYDQIGMETPSQSIPPECLSEVGLQGMVVAREAAEYYAKRPVRLNGCYEYTYRCENNIGGRQLAEWYMRDTLISLANRMYYISPGLLFDCKNGYYNTLWGASGIMDRAPFCYPKEAYVAYAVLTSVLDGVKFVRQLDTGSTTVYALEFKRMDGKVVTALWAARGEVLFEICASGQGTATHMLGSTESLRKRRSCVWGGTSPTYVVTDEPLRWVRIAGRTFKEDEAIAKRAKIAWTLDDASRVTLDPDPRYETKHHRFLPILKPSDFTVKQVQDEEKGPCIEVALDLTKHPETSRYITEYTTLRFKSPKEVPGKPVILGVWVKGNSNWGKIRFEIEDAKGEVFKNTTIDWGCDCQDWPANLAVNFDGWGYVYAALDENSFFTEHSPGTPRGQWVSMGNGNGKIDFPIKVNAITVPMNRTKLDLLDFKPSAPAIRLRDVGGTEDPLGNGK